MEIDISTIQGLAGKDRIAFKKHSIIRMHERNVSVDEVREVLIRGEIVEVYTETRPLPCCLVLGFRTEKDPVHVVVAVDVSEQMLWVITVYKPSKNEWDGAFKRRMGS